MSSYPQEAGGSSILVYVSPLLDHPVPRIRARGSRLRSGGEGFAVRSFERLAGRLTGGEREPDLLIFRLGSTEEAAIAGSLLALASERCRVLFLLPGESAGSGAALAGARYAEGEIEGCGEPRVCFRGVAGRRY